MKTRVDKLLDELNKDLVDNDKEFYLIIWMFYFGAFLSSLIIYVAMEFI